MDLKSLSHLGLISHEQRESLRPYVGTFNLLTVKQEMWSVIGTSWSNEGEPFCVIAERASYRASQQPNLLLSNVKMLIIPDVYWKYNCKLYVHVTSDRC